MAAKKKDYADYSRGFDRGNFGHAYESTDWESWYEATTRQDMPLNQCEIEGMLLGFFSTYELHEIEDSELRAEVEDYRGKWGGL